MKVIKKPDVRKGVCKICGAEYLISGKELRKAESYMLSSLWMDCKFCKRNAVKVINND